MTNISFRRRPGNLEAEILKALRAGPLSSVQIASRLGRTRQGVFTCLQGLASSGTVEVVDDPIDRRSVYWRLRGENSATVS